MKPTIQAAVAVILLGLGACANGPTLRESRAQIPPVAADRGRIYFYRTSSPFGSVIHPSVRLDGDVVGDSIPNGVFFCDVAPGHHTASVQSEVEKSADLDVAAGQSAYVKMDSDFPSGMGWLYARVQIEVVPPETGATEAAASSLLTSSCPASAT